MKKTRKDLSAEGLIKAVYEKFKKIKDPQNRNGKISITDCLMSCFAIFSLKYSSLLQYDIELKEGKSISNLKTLYLVKNPPSDTYMRERLDSIDPKTLRPAFKKVFSLIQRGKDLESYQHIDGHYLISIDGTGHFSSEKVHCKNCCEKHHRSGKITYYHQMLGAVMVHPEKKEVIPFCPEPIVKTDGTNKNDCERNASKRLLKDLRREHPHLKAIIVEDALAANAPHINLIEKLSMKYIIGVKPKDHKYLFDWVKNLDKNDKTEFDYKDEKGFHHKFSFANNVPLNYQNDNLKVHFLEYWEKDPKGRLKHFTWITNIKISIKNVSKIMRGGRARWRIENETFNTIKNQGYNFEHNFGHGKGNLCSVMGLIMMLAFLIDQTQLLCCKLFQQAKKISIFFYNLWNNLRAMFKFFYISSWKKLFECLAYDTMPDTS
jgi:hypothetical protein